jgi:hypothetical protein
VEIEMKLRFKKSISAMLLILSLESASVAQSPAESNLPRKVDSYGAIACDDAMARLDSFAIHLQNEPNSQGYIVVYRERNGLLGKYLNHMDFAKEYLVATRGISPERLATVSGGYRDNLTTEFWIASKDNPIPVTNTAIEENTRASRKFDEGFADYSMYEGKPLLWTSDLCGLGAIYLRAYAKQLRSEPKSKGYIIVYTEHGKRFSRWRVMARLLRDEMVKEHKIDVNRIVTVYGGRREIPEAELWIVSEGVSTPKPTPKSKRLS